MNPDTETVFKPRVLTVFGTRPEAIKLAPVIKELEISPEFCSITVATAQHREMLDQVLRLFEIVPDYDLDIMRPRQSLFDVTEKVLHDLREVFIQEKPDVVLVQGDTTTTFAAALAAFYLKISVGHVEAGLRTFNKYQPFPEETNRVLTTHLADVHFAPTRTAKGNLLKENIPTDKIYVTGNTVIDALLGVVKVNYIFEHPILSKIDFDSKRIILVTAHRRESWGEPLKNICEAIGRITKLHPQIEVVFSVHLNPQVREVAYSLLKDTERVHLIDPLDYEPFVQLMNKSYLVLTDSGGIQEEVPSLGKPVLVLREVTERPEGVEAGTVRVVGTNTKDIVAETERLLNDQSEYKKMARAVNPYGDGKSSKRIVAVLRELLSRNRSNDKVEGKFR
ncbi:UDP-N-acetylglucosamine 2-epimerase (non-hydrolyzing) [Candidatus Oleimmundimicrobium sp.]|uniref:non-hydrolyzing UDP-N-acetylglucosamine 2-epimerase n=1 Tax=Candidatus Oleimmundimicrobium sp. TaxID=3060597 RepID=UPI00272032C7|nr:UDP-N-acetylglucosamine 2-epimerase (non-hydrolyzing) [Candidatus Oleimmundimicrobium sp.]MDO8886360.1 UDP-N-acetylglucosamine 2-epimerase (non-hydrolyzing) [Candidatus Oleimmundimicrobium sp.]